MKENSICITARGYAMKPIPMFNDLNAGVGNVNDYLASPKSRKFMGKQDFLTVTALGRALEGFDYDGEKTGIYMSVGQIPFEKDILIDIARLSYYGNKFSMKQFVNNAVSTLNPLLTFRCLPNMPVYHASVNFGIKGPSYVTHPDIGEFYQCLERAINDLEKGKILTALVGGCVDVNNFLAKRRITENINIDLLLTDVAAFIVLELAESAIKNTHKIYYTLEETDFSYTSDCETTYSESFNDITYNVYMGPASLALFLNHNLPVVNHYGTSKFGYVFQSRWKGHIEDDK
ncbi:MAG: hypothetical protein OEV44_13625 [Spirochaetota bacterium]|nr:hypothetical protein [Spirochaetota bacterium]